MMNPMTTNCTNCGKGAKSGDFVFPVFEILGDGSTAPSLLCDNCIRNYLKVPAQNITAQ